MFGVINSSPQNVLVQWIVQKQLERIAQTYLKGKLIDIGCGTKPYREMISPYITEHIGVDHKDSLHDQSSVDLFGTAYHIQMDDETFDAAISTAVLEHLEEPELALKECYRVLKSGGIAVYSVPFIWHLHEEPRDFYRFTKYGLKYLFEKVGFEIIELNALSGFWVTFGQLSVYNLHRFNRGPLRWLHMIDGIGLVMQAIAYLLDRLDKTEQWTWMYMVVARKVGAGENGTQQP